MGDCAVSCIRYIIFAFNFLCFLFGISLLVGGIYVIAAHHSPEIHAGNVIFYVPVVPDVLIAVGFASSVIAFLGCCGAIMKNPCMLFSYSIVLLVLLVAQLGFGLYGLINYDQLIENGLTETLYAAKEQKELQKAWGTLQHEYKCCGVNQPTDWDPIYGHKKKLPPACCPKNWSVLSERGVKDCTIKDATKTGCKQKLVQFMKDHLIIWFVLGFTVVILVQIIGISFTCILFYVFHKQDRNM